MKKKALKALGLSILTIIFTISISSNFANAATTEEDYFPTSNSASYDFPLTLNVDSKTVVTTGNTGSLMIGDGSVETTPTVSIVLPIIICIIASVVAYLVLRQAKSFKQKSSETLELSSGKAPKYLAMVKNPALLLAVCFGLGCAVPAFFLQAGISRADSDEIKDLDYDTTDFQTYVDKKENPYGIKIDVSFNNTRKEGQTDEEKVEEAANSGLNAEPKSERKIEDNGEFIVGSVDATFTTYNPAGYFATYGMKSGIKCNATDNAEKLEKCYESTNLVSEDNIIPSITNKMSKADFEKLNTAAWGWSDDGEYYYPLYWTVDSTASEYEKNQTIYFAMKLTSSTPAGTYISANNFQIYAENNKLDNDRFAYYSISYKDGERDFVPAGNYFPLFLKERPGKIFITSSAPNAGNECKKFVGWSEKTQAEYDAVTDKSTIKLYKAGEAYSVSEKTTNYLLNAIWEETNEGCKKYTVSIDDSFKFTNTELNDDGDVVYEKTATHYCDPSLASVSDCVTTFTVGEEQKSVESLYIEHAQNQFTKTKATSVVYDLISDIGIPELKGFTFGGWDLHMFDSTSEEYVPSIRFVYNSKENKFNRIKYGEETVATTSLELTSDEKTTDIYIRLEALWALNSPTLRAKYYSNGGTLLGDFESNEENGTWDAESRPNDRPTIYTFNSHDGEEWYDGRDWFRASITNDDPFDYDTIGPEKRSFGINIDDLLSVDKDNACYVEIIYGEAKDD